MRRATMRLMKLLSTLIVFAGLSLAQGPVMQAVIPQYEAVKQNFVEAAEAMPEAEYGFKLSPAQRPYAEWVSHTAGMNARMCAQMKGAQAAPPSTGDNSKAALVKALKDSFQYCDATLREMTDEAALKTVGSGARPVTPLGIMISQIAQLSSHYGNMVGYLRAKGVVPPSTARGMQKK